MKESEGAQDVTGNDDKGVPGDGGGAGGEEIAPPASPTAATLPLAGAATAGTTAAVVEGEAANPVEGEQQEEGGERKRECDVCKAIFNFWEGSTFLEQRAKGVVSYATYHVHKVPRVTAGSEMNYSYEKVCVRMLDAPV